MTDTEPPHTRWWVYVRVFFTVLAAAIGTGIFALPVEVWRSGLGPFLVNYVLAMFTQLYFVMLVVEVFQRVQISLNDEAARRKQLEDSESAKKVDPENKEGGGDGVAVTAAPDSEGDGENEALLGKPAAAKGEKKGRGKKGPKGEEVNLYSISRVCLPKVMHGVWIVNILVHHVGILVSYALAASMSYGMVFGVGMNVVTIPFIFSSLLVVILNGCFKDVVTLLTVFKAGSLASLLVGVSAVAATRAKDEEWSDDWAYFLHPFIMSNVAIGGLIWIVPVLYSSISLRARDIHLFRAATCAGIVGAVCTVVAWTVMVLVIVPQTGPAPSLQDAKVNGRIATMPVVEVLMNSGGESQYLQYAGKGAHVLVVISVTVSFVIFGMSAKNLVDGMVVSALLSFKCMRPSGSGGGSFQLWASTLQAFVLLALFVVISVFVQFNPKSFFHVLKLVVCVALCVGNLLIVVMFWTSHRLKLSRPPLVNMGVVMKLLSVPMFCYHVFLVVFTLSAEAMFYASDPDAQYLLS